MNNSLIASLIFGILSTPLFAESIYERELKQLTEKRDKELATAAKPINLSYQAALQNLLLRASKNNDPAIPSIADALKTLKTAPQLPQSPEALLLGTWVVSSSSGWKGDYVYEAGGVAKAIEDNGQALKAKWTISASTLRVQYSDGQSDQIDFPPIEGKMNGKTGRGHTLSLRRKTLP